MNAEIPSVDLSGLELLVVEDDPVSRLMMSRILAKSGAEVVVAADGEDGLQKYLEHRFPVVITDINMPGMSGIELIDHIKKLDPGVKVIATSAVRDTQCLISAIGLGFSDYILKPLDVEKLLLAVQKCFNTLSVKRQLANEREKFRIVVESLGDGIIIKDLNYRITYQNMGMTNMFGDMVGTHCYKLFGFDAPCPDCPTVKAFQDNETHTACRTYLIGDQLKHFENTASLMCDSQGRITGAVEIIRDVSERVRSEETIRDLAFRDPLTGLANRRLFEDHLEQAIAKSQRYGTEFALFYLDLDHFKEINDAFGHDIGDLLLIEAADRIRRCFKRDLDTISRQGGDEFCIIVADCGERESLRAIAEKLLEQFDPPFRLNQAEVSVTTSIGISVFPVNGQVAKELQITADRAMYAAKKAGRNQYCFWEPTREQEG